jgi:hypothetical protein
MRFILFSILLFLGFVQLSAQTQNECSQACAQAEDYETCLCDCLTQQAQVLRKAESYDLAVAKLRAVESLCPNTGALQIIDSIFQNYRVWRYRNGKFALATPLGKVLTPFRFDDPQPFKNGKAVVQMGSKYYFLNKEGEILNLSQGFDAVIPAEHDLTVCIDGRRFGLLKNNGQLPVIWSYSSGNNKLAPALSYFGYPDSTHLFKILQIATDRNYLEVGRFFEGRATIQTKTGWGSIDSLGQEIIKPQFLIIFNYSQNGLWRVQTQTGTGLIDSVGNFLIQPKYNFLTNHNGLVQVSNDQGSGLISTSGKIILEPIYESVQAIGHNRFFVKSENETFIINKLGDKINFNYRSIGWIQDGIFEVTSHDNKLGLIDTLGNEILAPALQSIDRFYEGVATFQQNDRWGLLSNKGEILVEPKYISRIYLNRQDKYATVRTDDGVGVINIKGKEIVPPFYLDVRIGPNTQNTKFAFRTDKGWGWMDSLGNVVIEPQFEEIGYAFRNGRMSVRINGKSGWIDTTGNFIIEPKYLQTAAFNNNHAFAKTETGWLMIDTLGRPLTEPIYYDFYNDTDGNIAVKTVVGWGWIDSTGKEIIKPQYNAAFNFIQGNSLVKEGDSWSFIDTNGHELNLLANELFGENYYGNSISNIFHVRKYEKRGLLDSVGNILIYPKYKSISRDSLGFLVHTQDDLWGWTDEQGKVIIEPKYLYAQQFRLGKTKIRTASGEGYINTKGKIIIPPIYKEISGFYQGTAIITTENGEGLIDTTGKIMLQPKYQQVNRYNANGLAVIVEDSKWGLINRQGKVIVKPQYDNISYFRNGLAQITQEEKIGWIDTTGKVIIPPIYRSGWQYVDQLLFAETEKGWGIIDYNGKEVIPHHYTEIRSMYNKTARIKEDGKFGLIDSTGQTIIAPKYDEMYVLDRTIFGCTKNGLQGLINSDGAVLIPPKYNNMFRLDSNRMKVQTETGWGIVDYQGGEIIPTIYKSLNIAFKDIYAASTDNDSLYLIKESGEILYASSGQFIQERFSSKLSESVIVIESNTDGLRGLINKKGEILLAPYYDDIYLIDGMGLAEVTKDNLRGLIDTFGNEIVPPLYDRRFFLTKHVSLLERRNQYGLFLGHKKSYIPPIYDAIGLPDAKSWVTVKKGNYWGWVDEAGKEVIPIHFDAVSPFDETDRAWVFQHGMKFQINRKGEMLFASSDYKRHFLIE